MQLFLSFTLYTSVLLVYAFDHPHEEGVPEIHLKVFRVEAYDFSCKLVSNGLIKKDSSFNVYFYTGDEHISIYRPRCNIGEIMLKQFNRKDDYFVSKHNDIDINQDSEVNCVFYSHECNSFDTKRCRVNNYGHKNIDEGVKCNFSISYLYDAEIANGIIEVNGKKIVTGDSVTNEEEGKYWYINNSNNTFKCIKHKDSEGFIKMKYIPKEGPAISTDYQNRDHLSWYIKLMAENDGAAIECHFTSKSMSKLSIVKINLFHKNEDPFGFEVNGLVLPLELRKNMTNISYYGYYPMETLSIKILVKKSHASSLHCSDGGYDINDKGETNYVITLAGTELVFKCSVFDGVAFNFSLIIYELNYSWPFYPMTLSKILMMFTRESNIFNDITEFYYDNSLALTLNTVVGWICYKEAEKCRDNFVKNKTGTICDIPFKCSPNFYSNNIVYLHFIGQYSDEVLHNNQDNGDSDDNVTKTTIATSVTPTYVDKEYNENSYTNVENVTITTSTFATSVTPTNLDKENDGDSYSNVSDDGNIITPTFIIVAVVILLVIVITAIVLFRVCTTKKDRTTTEVMDYTSLPEHNEGPMPTPAQWSANLYATPIPKSQRKNLQEQPLTYASIREPYENLVGNTNLAGNTNLVLPDANAVYASVLPCDGNYANSPNVNTNYANLGNLYEIPAYVNK